MRHDEVCQRDPGHRQQAGRAPYGRTDLLGDEAGVYTLIDKINALPSVELPKENSGAASNPSITIMKRDADTSTGLQG